MEKRDCLIQFKLTKAEKSTMQSFVENLNVSTSDFIRQSVGETIGIKKKIEEGNLQCFIPMPQDIKDIKKVMIEFEELLTNQELSEHSKRILRTMSDYFELEAFLKLKKKYPNYNGFFNLSSLDEDI